MVQHYVYCEYAPSSISDFDVRRLNFSFLESRHAIFARAYVSVQECLRVPSEYLCVCVCQLQSMAVRPSLMVALVLYILHIVRVTVISHFSSTVSIFFVKISICPSPTFYFIK